MITVFFLIVSFILGYTLGFVFGKYKHKKVIREAFVMGYRECNKKWINRSVEEARKRLERRKTKNEIGSR